jgi:hypothetical protein
MSKKERQAAYETTQRPTLSLQRECTSREATMRPAAAGSDFDRLLEEIAAAQELPDLVVLEHAAGELIDALSDRLTDVIRERREYLNRP